MGLLSLFKSSSGVVEREKLSEDFKAILTSVEEIEVGFKLKDDTFIFTNSRLIVIEIKKGEESGLEYLSLPYDQMTTFSVQAKKAFDPEGTLKIWTRSQSEPVVEKQFNKSIDVYEVQRILASHLLGTTGVD